MIARQLSSDQLQGALALINARHYDGNIEWKSGPDPEGTGWHFTIQAIDTRGPGSRFSQNTYGWGKDVKTSKRRVKAACWHAHGHLFDAIFELSPDTWIRSAGRRVDAVQGNWLDWNAGSMAFPRLMSENCECEENDLPLSPEGY